MAVATLTVDFVARLGNLESAFNRSAQLSKQQATAIESAYGGAASTIKNLGAAIAGAFTVGSITAPTDLGMWDRASFYLDGEKIGSNSKVQRGIASSAR